MLSSRTESTWGGGLRSTPKFRARGGRARRVNNETIPVPKSARAAMARDPPNNDIIIGRLHPVGTSRAEFVRSSHCPVNDLSPPRVNAVTRTCGSKRTQVSRYDPMFFCVHLGVVLELVKLHHCCSVRIADALPEHRTLWCARDSTALEEALERNAQD